MSTDPEDIDLIERHLSGQLSHDEAVDFETRLEEDHEFARKLRLRKTFPSLFKAEGQDAIAMGPEETPLERVKVKKPRRFKALHLIWVAIFLLASAAICYFLFFRTEQSVKKAEVSKAVPKVVKETRSGPVPSVIAPATIQAAETTKASIPENKPPETSAGREAEAASDKSISLEAPLNGMAFQQSEEILFSWKMETDSFTNFYLFSETSNKLAWWRGIRPGTRECIIPPNKLSVGKFYWYVGSREYKRTLIITNQ